MRNVRRFLGMKPNSLFRHFVIEMLAKGYELNAVYASKLVRRSSFNIMLKKDPEFVMHYSADYWAKRVYDETVPTR
ncbi:MAG: hypothetical protein ACYDEQ_01410 [Desulfocucumaceae bacterium]